MKEIENSIAKTLTAFLIENYGKDYSYEWFINETVEIYAFSKIDTTEKTSIIRIGVNKEFEQIYIPNIFIPPFLIHKGVGKKLIHLVYEIGVLHNCDVFVVQLTDSFRDKLLKRGAINTNEHDTLQIVEATNLVEKV